jgi:hypothetical protein
MTNSRAIQSAATSEAKIRTHQESATSRQAMATIRTSQSRKNQRIGAAMRRSLANGARSFWKRKRDLSACGAPTISG